MKLGRVVGNVVSTINTPWLEDRTLLLVDLIGPDGELSGGYMIAVDSIGAGAGETVLMIDEGNSAETKMMLLSLVGAAAVLYTLGPLFASADDEDAPSPE